jgi:hypothetical protein
MCVGAQAGAGNNGPRASEARCGAGGPPVLLGCASASSQCQECLPPWNSNEYSLRGGVDSGDGARGVADGGTSEGRGCWGHGGGPMTRGGIDGVIVSEGEEEGDRLVEGEVGSDRITWEG